jgi:hypothetical protein
MRQAFLVTALAASLLNPATGATLIDSLWHLLASAWASADEGCIADPSGGCRPATAPQNDEGCGADPDGCPKGS